jgi:hypothetical protein
MPQGGWGAVVLGEPLDLEDWAHVLKEQFDPWVEIHGGKTVLRSAAFDELESATEVRDRGIAYIDRLNGAIAVSQNARPLRLGGVIRFDADGRLNETVFLQGHLELGRMKLHANLTVTGPDGQPLPPPPPQASEVQHWSTIADSEPLLDDALIYFGKATDWFDIYKCLECLILKFGPSEAEFLALDWAPSNDVERLKRIANYARHAKRRFDPPPKPMELRDARVLLGSLLRRALDECRRAPGTMVPSRKP